MTNEAGQFDEGFSAVPIRAQPAAPENTMLDPVLPASAALTPEDLGALLCRIPYTNLATGEQGEIVMSAEDWRGVMARHHLEIRRTTT